MRERTALVTLAVGAEYVTRWHERCEPGWRSWAERHGYEVVCIKRALDHSDRARSRSPAWQKCLVASAPEVAGYDRLIWMDADVVVNPSAPSITACVPPEAVGAVDEFATPSREVHARTLAKLFRQWEARKQPYVHNLTPAAWYAQGGFTPGFDEVVQTGVLVISPEHHAELLERVYHDYEDRPGLNYEMRPLSFELLSAGAVHWLDPRFNYIWGSYAALHHPFLVNHPGHPGVAGAVRRALADVFCLHFAGNSPDIEHVGSATSARRPITDRTSKSERPLRTPVAMAIFRRADTTARVLAAVRTARPERLLVFADGPRPDSPGEAARCAEARAVIDSVDWECEVETAFSDEHLGLRRRMVSGLDWVFDRAEEAIVLEDDTLPEPSFFSFCEELLARYRDEPRVMGISGNDFRGGASSAPASYSFSRYQLIWGWATWRRAWAQNDAELSEWPALRTEGWLERVLDSPHAVGYWAHLFDRAHDGMDTWDYGWMYSCWRHGGLAALPAANLVSNLGFREDATHTRVADGDASPFAAMATSPVALPLAHPPMVERDGDLDAFLEEVAYSGNVTRMFDRLRAVRRAREAAR